MGVAADLGIPGEQRATESIACGAEIPGTQRGGGLAQPEARAPGIERRGFRQITVGLARGFEISGAQRVTGIGDPVGPGAAGGCEKRTCRDGGGLHRPPAGGRDRRCDHEQNGGQQQPLVELDGDGALAAFDFEGIEIVHDIAHHFRHASGAGGHGVAATGLAGELAHHVGLEAADDRLAITVHHAALREIRIGNVVAILGADADGDDEHSGLDRLVDQIVEIVVVFFAIAEDDERVVFLAGLLERLDGEAEGIAEIGTAAGDPVFVDLLDRLTDRAVIDGERRIDVGRARETDQSHALVGHAFHQFVDRHLGTAEAVGFHVLNAHAAREVEGKEDVAAE